MLFDLTHRPRRHSYSSLKLFNQCKAAYGYRYIAKLADEPTAAMARGTRLHSLCEDYLNHKGEEVAPPYDIRKIALKIYTLRGQGAKAEEVWLLDNDWQPTEDEGRAKIKAIIDVYWRDNGVLRIHDYKSGRAYPEHDDQLEFYSAVGLQRYPDAQRAEASALYIDSGNEGGTISTIREMLPHRLRKWQGLVDSLDGERQFLPSAGGHCKRCGYRDDQGGPCAAWREA